MQPRATNHARLDDSADSSPRATRDTDLDLHLDDADGDAAARRSSPAHTRTMPRDIPSHKAAAQSQKPLPQSPSQSSGLLGASLFPSLDDVGASGNINQMQTDDPLAAQIWKFFSKTKQQLPNQQRMENLTWRMMALNMRKRQQEESRQGYVFILVPFVYSRALLRLTLLPLFTAASRAKVDSPAPVASLSCASIPRTMPPKPASPTK